MWVSILSSKYYRIRAPLFFMEMLIGIKLELEERDSSVGNFNVDL